MTNRFGLDVDYYRKELKQLEKTLDDRTPEELWRYFGRICHILNKQLPTDEETTDAPVHGLHNP